MNTRSRVCPAIWVEVSINCTKSISKIKLQNEDEFKLVPDRVSQSMV